MKLLSFTLKDELSQDVNYIGDERVSIGAFIPYIYCHNASGVFNFQLIRDNIVIFEQQFNAQDIKDEFGTYTHVFYPIVPDINVVLEKGEYTFKLLPVSGYNPDYSSFIGWITQFEDIQNERIDDNLQTLAIRFKCYKEGINA